MVREVLRGLEAAVFQLRGQWNMFYCVSRFCGALYCIERSEGSYLIFHIIF